jgi:hypothetical protein
VESSASSASAPLLKVKPAAPDTARGGGAARGARREARAARRVECHASARALAASSAALSARARGLVAQQDMEAEEYENTKAETLKQLEEFHASLSRLMARA